MLFILTEDDSRQPKYIEVFFILDMCDCLFINLLYISLCYLLPLPVIVDIEAGSRRSCDLVTSSAD